MRSPILLALAVLWAIPRAGADGMLDPGFGSGGLVTTAFPGQFAQDAATSLVMLPDGRAVAAGSTNINLAFTEMAVARYLTTGALDSSFDGDGLVTVAFFLPPPQHDAYSEARAVLLQPDGRLVLAGVFNSGPVPQQFFALARLNADGSLDSSFGQGGKAMTPVPTGTQAVAGLLQPDGRIVVAGSIWGNGSVALARYNADGSLDTTFGTTGFLLLPVNGGFEPRDLALQPDGKLLVGGTFAPFSSADFGVLRLLPNGSLDASFDGDGVASSDFGAFEEGYSVIVLPDGRIVLGGSRSSGQFAVMDFTLVRYLTDGTLDTTFGTGGLGTGDSGASDRPDQLIRLHNGNLLVAGFNNDNGGNPDFLLARFLADGALDTSFGTAGFLRTDFAPGTVDECHAVALAGPDRILTAGRTGLSFPADFGLARYIATTPVELLAFEVE